MELDVGQLLNGGISCVWWILRDVIDSREHYKGMMCIGKILRRKKK